MLEQMLPFLFRGLILMVLLMAVLWAVHFKIKNAGIVDFGWALGLALLGALYGFSGSGFRPRRLLMASMVLAWGLRLASHILFDRVLNKPEDERYKTLRKNWKDNLTLKFFLFFEFQALLDVVLALPFLLMAINPAPSLRMLEWLGFGLWLIALAGEALADSQLKDFKAHPENRGKTCRVGLWNYSRHPNYFFEWLIWVGYFLTALASPGGWASLISPVLMLYFLLNVTGIPMTEAQALKTKGEDYRNYQRTTSAFVPWFKTS